MELFFTRVQLNCLYVHLVHASLVASFRTFSSFWRCQRGVIRQINLSLYRNYFSMENYVKNNRTNYYYLATSIVYGLCCLAGDIESTLAHTFKMRKIPGGLWMVVDGWIVGW